jgi:hypothetical protein
MSSRVIPRLALLVALFSAVTRADEIRLKDGTKIIGTIVGFENGSFRVETSYGFALIEKDKVADINITAAKKEPEPKLKSSVPATPAPPPAPPPSIAPAVAKESSSPTSPAPGANALTPERAAAARSEIAPLKPQTVAATPPATPPAPPSVAPPKLKVVAVAPPAAPPAPEPVVIRDEIRGNLYVNLTYGFQMYRPPSWDLIPDARKALPDAVAALGTSDQTTLLVVGREQTKESLEAHAVATGKALSGVYENYRLISNRHVSVAGFPAIEQRSRGTADGHDWSVTLMTFLRGNDAFTLLGMTWADSDLIQVEENVISKTVNSLTFAK